MSAAAKFSFPVPAQLAKTPVENRNPPDPWLADNQLAETA
jgi:hypothetical protein